MKRSIFIRYAVSYTLILLALFAGLTFYLVQNTQARVREEIIDSQVNRLTRIAMQHESAIATMLSTAEEIGLSPHIESFVYADHPAKAYDLQRQLIPYTAINSFCDQMYLFFPEDERLYSSSAAMTLERYLRLNHFERLEGEELQAMLRAPGRLTVIPAQRLTSEWTEGADVRVIGFVLPLGANPGISKGSIFFLVRESSYQSLLADAIDQRLNTYIFDENQLLTGAEALPLGMEDLAALDGERGEMTLAGTEWLQVAVTGRSWGMRYVALVPRAEVNSAASSSLTQMLWMLAGLMALAFLMILWMSRRHARPIREISSMLAADEAPRQDDLKQISSGIRQLTTRNDELSSRLEQALPLQRHDFVLRFMRGRFAGQEEAARAAEALGLNIRRAWFAVILSAIPAEWDHPFEMSMPPFSVLPGMTAVGVELMAMKANLYLAFAEEQETLDALAEEIRKKGSGSEPCVTAISLAHQRFEEAPSAYLEAAAAYENRFVMGQARVLAYADIPSGWTDVLPRARKITQGIRQALTLRNREMLEERIGELMRFLKTTEMSPFAFRMIYNDVIDTLTGGERGKMAQAQNPREFDDIFSLTSCQSIDDLEALLRRLCDWLLGAEGADEAVLEGSEDEMDQAVRYMREHYADPELSMAAIAESLNLSTARLSLNFKEKVGMTPSEYLTMLRCQRAKELLATTEETIRDIGAAVGYYDAGSFIRRFRQVTGETPLQYRKSCGTAQISDLG